MTRSEIIASCRKGAEMSAQVIQIRDYQPKRKEEKLKEQAAEILSQIDTSPGSGIDGLYVAPEKDPA